MGNRKLKIVNLINKRFGNLVVLYQVESRRNGAVMWECKCDCGSTTRVRGYHLTRNTKPTKSCGCLKERRGPRNPNWRGYEEISGPLWNQIKRGANGEKGRREIPFKITIEFVWELFLKQDRKCALSKLPIEFSKYSHGSHTASLDRINSSRGYTNNNVQWVHKDINKMKNSYDENYFIKLCKEVSKNNT